MRRAQSTAATRQAIIAAARDLLAGRDWRRFTLEAVAARAGVTRVTVYNQMGNKYGVLDAVLTELAARGGMDRLVTAGRSRPAPDAFAQAVDRTCRFWHTERAVLRPLSGLAAIDAGIAANLGRREGWRSAQFARLTGRSPGDPALAGIVAVTSFPAYDALGALADDPERAATVILRMANALLEPEDPAFAGAPAPPPSGETGQRKTGDKADERAENVRTRLSGPK
jgi:AcrR family transcriptional regulator